MKYVHHHLGLGDHIVCNGLINQLLLKYGDTIGLFTKKQNQKNVQFLYRNNPNITVIPVNGDGDVDVYCKKYKIDCVKIGHGNLFKFIEGNDWVKSFYNQMNVDYNHRWNSFSIDRDEESENKIFEFKNPNNKKYALIHSTSSDGSNGIDYSKIDSSLLKIEVTNETIGTNTIFDYIKLIFNATEVHCIDSSFIHLVDSFQLKNNLFYHKQIKYRGWTSEYKLKNDWKII